MSHSPLQMLESEFKRLVESSELSGVQFATSVFRAVEESRIKVSKSSTSFYYEIELSESFDKNYPELAKAYRNECSVYNLCEIFLISASVERGKVISDSETLPTEKRLEIFAWAVRDTFLTNENASLSLESDDSVRLLREYVDKFTGLNEMTDREIIERLGFRFVARKIVLYKLIDVDAILSDPRFILSFESTTSLFETFIACREDVTNLIRSTCERCNRMYNPPWFCEKSEKIKAENNVILACYGVEGIGGTWSSRYFNVFVNSDDDCRLLQLGPQDQNLLYK